MNVVAESLLTLEAEALILSANKRLNGGSGLSAAVERAGPTFMAERDRIVPTGPSNGFFRGTAVVTSSGNLAAGRLRRRLIHAITIKYEHGHRLPTTPEIVYAAVRDALDRAEVYGIGSLGTYLMATRTARSGRRPGPPPRGKSWRPLWFGPSWTMRGLQTTFGRSRSARPNQKGLTWRGRRCVAHTRLGNGRSRTGYRRCASHW